MANWNPWHGCQKISAGCMHCYVYRRDSQYEKDSSIVTKNKDFDLPIRKKRNGEYVLKTDEVVFTCLTSDFFLDKADEWRKEAWKMIKERSDLYFFIITKRIDRFLVSLPSDWGDGYENVIICSTCENQDRADYRLHLLLKYPIKHKQIACEPLLTKITLEKYLTDEIECVTVGGESGNEARICDYNWVLDIREQCIRTNTQFYFKQTGAKFLYNKKLYYIKRALQHSQARKSNINILDNRNNRKN